MATGKVCILFSLLLLLAGCSGKIADPPASPLRVMFVGDSITACFSDPCVALTGPGLPLEKGWQGINNGLSGATTAQILPVFPAYALTPQTWPDGVTSLPDVVIIEENTNDFTRGLTLEETTQNIDTMIALAEAAGLVVVVQTMLPTGHVGIDAYDGPDYALRYNGSFLPNEASKRGITIANTYATIVDATSCNSSGECFAGAGLLVDGKHPSEHGFAQMYPAIKSAIAAAH